MSISKYNYEAYFLDYYEGRLDAAAVHELMDFISCNPQFKTEFENFELISLTELAENIKFDNKESLKKNSSAVNASNFDDIAIQYIEGTLNSVQIAELFHFVKQNPAFEKELAIYRQTKLVADETVLFENKDSLKRYSRKRPVAWYYWSAAASVVLAMVIYALLNNKTSPAANSIVSNKVVNTVQLANNSTPTHIAAQHALQNAGNSGEPVSIVHHKKKLNNNVPIAITQNNNTTVAEVKHEPIIQTHDTVPTQPITNTVALRNKDTVLHINITQHPSQEFTSHYAKTNPPEQNKPAFAFVSNTVKSVRRFFKRNIGVNRYYSKESDKVIAYQITLGDNRYTLPVRNSSY